MRSTKILFTKHLHRKLVKPYLTRPTTEATKGYYLSRHAKTEVQYRLTLRLSIEEP